MGKLGRLKNWGCFIQCETNKVRFINYVKESEITTNDNKNAKKLFAKPIIFSNINTKLNKFNENIGNDNKLM